MARGGTRVGAGRKRGGVNTLSLEARKAAAETGALPHEFMLGIMRNPKETKERRLDAAKAAAPYYAPRLAAIVAKINAPGNPWKEILDLVDGKYRGLPAKEPGVGGKANR